MGTFKQGHHLSIGGQKVQFEYSQSNLRLETPYTWASFIVELTYSRIRQEYQNMKDGIFGDYMAGLNLMARNYVYENKFLSPYFQVQAGALYTDAYKYNWQDYIGYPVEFVLGGSIGAEFDLMKGLPFIMEYRGEHISNAGLSERNNGVNAPGFLFGIKKEF
jgi:hypothetical protein